MAEYVHNQLATNHPCDRNNCRCGDSQDCMYYNSDPQLYGHDDYHEVQFGNRDHVINNDPSYLQLPDVGNNTYLRDDGFNRVHNEDDDGILDNIEDMYDNSSNLMKAGLIGAVLVVLFLLNNRFRFVNMNLNRFNRNYVIAAIVAIFAAIFFFAKK